MISWRPIRVGTWQPQGLAESGLEGLLSSVPLALQRIVNRGDWSAQVEYKHDCG